jgi:outer membrane protein assembly factor BamD
MYLLRIAAILGLITLVAGCALTADPQDKTQDWPASKIYSTGKKALDSGDYETALSYFETLEARYPFGRHAQQAQLDIAYSYYKQGETDSAISIIDRFIRSYPRHPHLDYAYYLRALANFSRDRQILDRIVRSDPSHRDPGSARQSFDDFEILVIRFPNSRYAEDARQRMVYLRNNLANHEIHVANYYIKRGAYVAAANRAKFVVENYQQTPAVPDALVVLVKAYTKLDMDELKDNAMRVLMLNYPDHPLVVKTKSAKRR